MEFNGKTFAILAMAAGLATSTPVWAQEFQSADGVMTIEAPDGNWEEVKNADAVMALTDGQDKIILEHYSNGEKLPAITVADSNYARTCQNVISTEDEVFIVTGYAEEKDGFPKIQKAVESMAVQKYGTKKKVKASSKTAGESSGTQKADIDKTADKEMTKNTGEASGVEDVSFTGWVKADQVNVRSDCTVDSGILGQVYLENTVSVTGYVESGKDGNSWYQIDYEGEPGYVAEEFLSDSPSTAELKGIELTDECVTIYRTDGSAAAYVYKSTDGNWYDGSGRPYEPDGDGMWTLTTDGSSWTEQAPESPADNAVDEASVQDADGLNSDTLYLGEDGVWRNEANGIYTDNGDGTWTGPDGESWYEAD